MDVAADVTTISAGTLHTFNRFDNMKSTKCALCREQCAYFRWSKQEDDRTLRDAVPVCRTCAGMIVLVGKER